MLQDIFFHFLLCSSQLFMGMGMGSSWYFSYIYSHLNLIKKIKRGRASAMIGILHVNIMKRRTADCLVWLIVDDQD